MSGCSSSDEAPPMEPVFIEKIESEFDANSFKYPADYEGHFDGVMIRNSAIRARVRQLAALLQTDYQGKRPVLICTLKGACPFFVHLCDALQEMRMGYDMEFVRASSYDGSATTGVVTMVGELKVESILNRHLILVEDIVDTGTTLATLLPVLQEHGKPASLQVVTLLDKRLDQKSCTATYIGFSIPNFFIIGYGLDYNELYRDLQDIFVISKQGIDFDATKLHR